MIEHPEELWPMYDLISETQSEGHVCILVCRPGSKPNTEQLKARGVVLGDLIVNLAKDEDELRKVMLLGVNSEEVRTFIV